MASCFDLMFTLLFPWFWFIFLLFPFGNITVVSEHNIGSACASWKANMSSEEGDPLTDREKRYLGRRHRKFDYIDDKEDKGKTPLSREDEVKEYPKLLLRIMQDIAKEIKEMSMDRYKESPKGFLHGEGSGISHHSSDQPVK